MDDINKNTGTNFQEESNNNSPDITIEKKDINNNSQISQQVPIEIQNELRKNLFSINRKTRYYIYI